jgi:hypothetical protein
MRKLDSKIVLFLFKRWNLPLEAAICVVTQFLTSSAVVIGMTLGHLIIFSKKNQVREFGIKH